MALSIAIVSLCLMLLFVSIWVLGVCAVCVCAAAFPNWSCVCVSELANTKTDPHVHSFASFGGKLRFLLQMVTCL